MLRAVTDMSDEIIYYKVHLVSLLINIHDPILCTSPEQEYSIIWLQHNKKLSHWTTGKSFDCTKQK